MSIEPETVEIQLPKLDPVIKGQLLRWIWHWMGRLTVALFVTWMMAVSMLGLGFRYLGESNPFTVFLMFLPPAIWVLPGVFIWPLVLLFRWRSALLLGLVSGVILYCLSGWKSGTAPEPLAQGKRDPQNLVILTNNRGQHGGHSLRPFKNFIQPDLMLFQESSAQAKAYLTDPGYSEFKYGESAGEFTILSRYPVSPGKLIIWKGGAAVGTWPVAARFEVEWNGRKIAVYGVHLRSPRGNLLAMRGGGFLYGLPMPFSFWQERSKHLASFWLDQISMAEELLHHLADEKLPCIVAGDFNAPHLGLIHRRITQQLQDTHSVAGYGMGFTFPGETRNPLSLGGPWLRIDQIHAHRDWQVEACWTEQGRRSQHRAVAASLKWREE